MKLTPMGSGSILTICLLVTLGMLVAPLETRTTAATPQAASAPTDAVATHWEQQRVLREISAAWRDRKFEKVTAHFSASLQENLPAEKLASVWSEITSRLGSPRDIDVAGRQRFGTRSLRLIQLKWKSARLDLRLDFDDQNHVAGLWIDRPLGDDPTGRKGWQYLFGERVQQIASWNLTLSVRVQSADELPEERCRIAFLHEVSDDQAEQGDHWQDPADGRRWRHFVTSNGDPAAQVTGLPSGWYRVIALKRTNDAPMIASDPIHLASSHVSHLVTLPEEQSGTIECRAIAKDSGDSLDRPRIRLETISDQWPTFTIKPSDTKNGSRFEDLPPGKYRAVGYRRADRWDGMRYESVEKGNVIELVSRQTTQVDLDFAPRKLTAEEIAKRAPWVAQGRVTDEQGNPLPGVAIWASAGWGSLHSYEIATTDEQGKYFGRFATSGWVSVMSDPDRFQVVSAQVGAHKDGFAESNVNRGGRGAASSRRPRDGEDLPVWVQPDRLFTPGVPVEINFVMRRAAQVTVTMLGADGSPLTDRKVRLDGDVLPPASSVMGVSTTNHDGTCVFSKVPVDFNWWFDVNLAERSDVRSRSMNFSQGQYDLVLMVRREFETGKDMLAVVSATKGTGVDATSEIASTDPRDQAPLGAAEQEQTRRLVADILEANRYWLGNPPEKIRGFEYDFQLADQPKQHVLHRKGMTDQRRGISYLSPLDELVRRPQDAVFRSVKRIDGQIELAYSFKENKRVYAGNGIRGRWKGYFSTGVSDALLVVDAETLTPLEQQSDKFRETFSDYVRVDEGHYVPLRIQIDKMNLDWTFKLHDGGLWLFDRSTKSKQHPDPIASVSNVVIE